ncbi:MAG: 6-phosphogluconolactonase [Planctomycetes bacterium]|nr:6-phosphogluconolactonase [Planctomycetota bacterium]
MELSIHPDADALAAAAAARIACLARAALDARGRFALAVSGGSTPWAMLRQLAGHALDWTRIDLFQVDERAAPDGSDERNWTHLRTALIDPLGLPAARLHAMPVGRDDAPVAYQRELRATLGVPPVLDLVQLGLGTDGHTASLVPGDPALDVEDVDVTWTAAPYQGTRRLTLTFPCIARARRVLWLVAGAGKRAMVRRLLAADRDIPAGRVAQDAAELFGDAAAVPRTMD